MPGFLIILAMTSWPMATVSAPHALRLAAGVPGSVGWAGFGGGIAAGMLGTAGATGAGTGGTGTGGGGIGMLDTGGTGAACFLFFEAAATAAKEIAGAAGTGGVLISGVVTVTVPEMFSSRLFWLPVIQP